MSDFWARKLSQSPAGPPAHPQSSRGGLDRTGTPWWASSAYGSPPAPPQAAAPEPQQPDPQYVTVRAASASVDSHCPNCGGTSYFRATHNTQPHCFECGHQDRFRQSMSGVAVVNDTSMTSKPSIKQAGGSYQPKTIIGRI